MPSLDEFATPRLVKLVFPASYEEVMVGLANRLLAIHALQEQCVELLHRAVVERAELRVNGTLPAEPPDRR